MSSVCNSVTKSSRWVGSWKSCRVTPSSPAVHAPWLVKTALSACSIHSWRQMRWYRSLKRCSGLCFAFRAKLCWVRLIASIPLQDIPLAHLLRPSTGGLPAGLATKYVAFPRSQYYAPSATLRPLQPQVVQSPRDRSQRFPRSPRCPLHSGLGRSWTPIRCALHPRYGPYALTPIARTVGSLNLWLGQFLNQATPQLTPASSFSRVSTLWTHCTELPCVTLPEFRPAASGSWMRYCPLPLVPSGFRRVLPPCPSPAELASRSLGYALGFTDYFFLLSLPFKHDSDVLRGAQNRACEFPSTRLLSIRTVVIGTT